MAKAATKKASAGKAAASNKNKEEQLPDLAQIEQTRSALKKFCTHASFSRLLSFLYRLQDNPPQSLLLEGGTADERFLAAMLWSLLLNCPEIIAAKAPTPCLECPTCTRILGLMHRDFFLFDGSKASIKIDEIREMRTVLGEPPREAEKRVVIFHEAQALGEASANSLLKSLEEPRPDTRFVLTVPQRERLLPTLVSRSWVLTLPWPSGINSTSAYYALTYDEAVANINSTPPPISSLGEWEEAIIDFACTGRGWMERSSRRGAIDNNLAMQLVLLCQSSLLQALTLREKSTQIVSSRAGLAQNVAAQSGSGQDGMSANNTGCKSTASHNNSTRLVSSFSRLSLPSLKVINEVLAEAQESLNFLVNPALVLDWMLTRIYFLFSRDGVR